MGTSSPHTRSAAPGDEQRKRRCATLNPMDQANAYIFHSFGKLMIFFCPRRCLSLPEASLSGKTLPTSLHSFHVKTPLWRKLQRLGQLTPHKGGLWVQLANVIKQDEAETLQFKKRQELVTLARGGQTEWAAFKCWRKSRWHVYINKLQSITAGRQPKSY